MAKPVIEIDDDGEVIIEPSYDPRFNRCRKPEARPGDRRRKLEGGLASIGRSLKSYFSSDKEDGLEALDDALDELEE